MTNKYIIMYTYMYTQMQLHTLYICTYLHTCTCTYVQLCIPTYMYNTCIRKPYMYIIHMYVVVTCTIFIVLICMYISMYLSTCMYIQTCIHKSYYYRYTHILPLFVSVADRVCRKSLYNFVTLNATE